MRIKINVKTKSTVCIVATVIIIILGIGIGSVFVAPRDIISVLGHKIFNMPLPDGFDNVKIGLVWNLRFPRVMLSFCVGGALAMCGAVMQSVLRNPLASSYGLGVSSGAGLGIVLIMVTGLYGSVFFQQMSTFFMPLTGLAFGLVTVFLAVWLAYKMDGRLDNNTIILTGMVFSLFINAIMSTLAATSPQYAQRIAQWQLGSFSMKDGRYVLILLAMILLSLLFFQTHSKELDILTFGEEHANSLGVDLKRTKWLFIIVTAALTGTAVAFAGIIGFVDLIAPHVVRRYFGASHRIVIPICILFGGSFMVIADLMSRMLASPSEIPVGSITALVGTPFFIYVYLKNRKNR